MRKAHRTAVAVVTMLGLSGCAGGRARLEIPEGAASPEEAVEVFLSAAREAVQARRGGAFTDAERAYERMAAVFGTEQGSIQRAYSAQEVRDRMVVLAACLRPVSFRFITQPDPGVWRTRRTTVTIELTRATEMAALPFRVVLGRGERWFIEQIDLSSFAC
ncbi:MAG: hypothetical protein JSV41_13240 [Gemmatimonadota bacterium]|nr:MAG: hypothetical protein JSV41_13240 [Gemmatimonadota bacterium]